MEQFSFGRQAMKFFDRLYGKKTFRMLIRYDELVRRFRRKFKSRFCYLASSPGRVELIGNHTDHNGGKVIGCTVDSDIVAAFLPNSRGKIHIEGNGYRDINFSLDDIFKVESGSVGMVKGVLAGLKNRGYAIGGFHAVIDSTLKGGAGMSSSAAFELLTASIENSLFNNGKIPAEILAEVGQWAENTYFNKPCGLLDQGVISVGGIVKIDFKNGFYAEQLKNNIENLNLIVVDTGKSHSSLTAHYAEIPADMKKVAEYFGKDRLADVDETEFFARKNKVEQTLGAKAVARAEHFFEENSRVDLAAKALQSGNTEKLLNLLNDSGNSSIEKLKNCEVDGDSTIADAVKFAREICPECASRVHGGGFQGTILAVVDNKNLKNFEEKMSERFGKENVKTVHIRDVGATVL